MTFRAARDQRPRSALSLLGALAASLLLAGCSAGADTGCRLTGIGHAVDRRPGA